MLGEKRKAKSRMATLFDAKNAADVRQYLSQGENINSLNISGMTPFMFHCGGNDNGNIEVVCELIENDCDVTLINLTNGINYGHNGFTKACENGHTELVRNILNYQQTRNLINVPTVYYTPLGCTIMEGHTDIFDMLIEAGANINLMAGDEYTPLMEACIRNQVDIVDRLLKLGADVNFQGCEGMSAIFHCKSTDVLNRLYNYGANLDIRNDDGNTPLNYIIFMECIYGPQYEVVMLLLNYCNNVNIPNNNGETPLFNAVSCDKQDLVKLLLDYGADGNIANNEGKTALDYALELGAFGIIQLISQKQ